jgi:hypothetical protein
MELSSGNKINEISFSNKDKYFIRIYVSQIIFVVVKCQQYLHDSLNINYKNIKNIRNLL